MSDKYNAVTDGTYVFQEGEEKNQFFFFRKDGGEINKDEADPMDLYQAYVCRKMMESNNPQMVMSNLRFETSTDNKCIRITIMDFDSQELPENKSTKKKEGFIKRLKARFGKKEKVGR